jgi:hypothetical protein
MRSRAAFQELPQASGGVRAGQFTGEAMMTYQLLGCAAIIVGLIGTWLAAGSRRGWLVCIASIILWLPALVTGD